MGAQPDPEAEVAVGGGLRRLGLRGDDQRVPRIQRDDGGPDTKSRHGRADQAGQPDGVVIELLGQPDLADPGVVGAAGLGDGVVDMVGRLSVGNENDSGGHVPDSDRTVVRIPFAAR